MKKQKTLQDRLAQSLDKTNKQKAPPLSITPVTKPAVKNKRKCKKLCISLFKTDLAMLEGIRSFMANNGERITISQAVKLALRTAPLSNGLIEAMAATNAEDGRTAA